jgi:hypothetical protein
MNRRLVALKSEQPKSSIIRNRSGRTEFNHTVRFHDHVLVLMRIFWMVLAASGNCPAGRA